MEFTNSHEAPELPQRQPIPIKLDEAVNDLHMGGMLQAPAPSPAKRCPDCGAAMPAQRAFCAPACRQRFHNRQAKRGRVIMPYMLAWRGGRGSGGAAKAAFTELCAYLDHCNAQDKAAGRPPMRDYTATKLDWNGGQGWREKR
jgi:predicted nucleic acid-binding Zn ribbon protein